MSDRILDSKYGTKWSEDETILAYFYYCQIPFGKIHKTNPEVIRIANLLNRTPSSVALKMGNLGHFDPELRKRNISGLKNASKTDAVVVSEFNADWYSLSIRAKEIETRFIKDKPNDEYDNNSSYEYESEAIPAGLTKDQAVKVRIGQQFFRKSVLAAYQGRCCITGIPNPELLLASHIKPWKDSNSSERTNPSNGLCLNPFHDRAFDKGLITINSNFSIIISSKLKNDADVDDNTVSWIMKYEGEKIHLPEKFAPAKEFLQYHNDMIFIP